MVKHLYANTIVIFCLLFFRKIAGYVHPIITNGRYFVDSVTNEPFFIKGVDYQPGGSSGVSDDEKPSDPLSNPDQCARDIALFQDLGINTIRIYSINVDLNHDICMSMLAIAGIYLVLDVNSPLQGHHLNRYEPWTTYNTQYLENVFKIVEQFSYYNNTLGFFAGNEIINDKLSAQNSPNYVKAIIRDIKLYIENNSPRSIPVGYSAADDLKYRISLSSYLECIHETSYDSIDFFGVNSYQWCGEQTFYTSGYNVLVDNYSNYSKPLFFSEYGCNEVSPRVFEEVQSLYSNNMVDVFSGGLVYEFTQEPNNYGLIINQPNGDVKLLSDYLALKNQFRSLREIDYNYVFNAMQKNLNNVQSRLKNASPEKPTCETSYKNLVIAKELPESLAKSLISSGVKVKRGKLVEISDSKLTSKNKVISPNGKTYMERPRIERIVDMTSGMEVIRKSHNKGFNNSASRNGLTYIMMLKWSIIVLSGICLIMI